jgi:hypothetical protein
MKLLSHAMIDDTKETSFPRNDLLPTISNDLQNDSNQGGHKSTPRFPTDEEIDEVEKRLLLSFAFKDDEEIERYRREMIYIVNQD